MALAFASGTITVTGGATAGTATSGSTTTIADTGKSWTTNQWAGRHVWIHTGTGNGQWRVVLSNTATVLTVDRAFSAAINNTSQYIVAHNFADVLAANNAGSWGVVSGAGSQYRLAARIFIGDGTSGNRGCFGDLNKSITFTSGSITSAAFTGADFWSYTHILLKDFSAMLFGNVLNAANKITVDGMSFLSEVVSPPGIAFTIGRYNIAGTIPANPSLAVIASCKFGRTASRTIFYVPATNGESYLWNCDFDRVELNPGVLDTFNVTVQGGIYGAARVAGPFDRAIVAGIAGPAVYASPLGEVAGTTFRNLITRNCTSWFQFFDNPTLDVFMVNPDPDVRTITAVGTPGGSARLWEQYEFDLTVRRASDNTAISGTRIRLTDSTGAEVFNNVTDANGAIATQTLNRGFYTRIGLNTLTARTPHVMRIRRYGFLPFQLGVNATVKQAFNDFRAADAFVVASEATAGAYTGIAMDGVAKTITISAARTVQELYDFVQWWQVQSGNIQYDVSLTTADGINYIITSGWTLIGAANLTFGSRSFSGALRFTAAGAYSPRLGTATTTFTAAGTYDFRGATISGTVTLTNTSGGAVTVQLQPGVTFVNSGPNITVDNAVSANFTVSGMVAGSRLLIRRTDNQAVLLNETVAGTSRTYTYTYTADIPVEIVVRKATGSPAYQEWRTTATLTSSGGAVTANQQLDE
jgi:hypothetical protein